MITCELTHESFSRSNWALIMRTFLVKYYLTKKAIVYHISCENCTFPKKPSHSNHTEETTWQVFTEMSLLLVIHTSVFIDSVKEFHHLSSTTLCLVAMTGLSRVGPDPSSFAAHISDSLMNTSCYLQWNQEQKRNWILEQGQSLSFHLFLTWRIHQRE